MNDQQTKADNWTFDVTHQEMRDLAMLLHLGLWCLRAEMLAAKDGKILPSDTFSIEEANRLRVLVRSLLTDDNYNPYKQIPVTHLATSGFPWDE